MDKKPVVRTIYNSYDLWDSYSVDAKEVCIDNDIKPTEQNVWDEIYFMDSCNWDDEREQLIDFFSGSTWILQGTTGLWTGRHKGGCIFTDFMDMYYIAAKDCGYVHIYDENGHFYIKCSHHDGTNLYEIKKLTDKGVCYLERWANKWIDKRKEEYIHDKIVSKYSVLPNYAHKVYECKKREFVTE